MKRLAKITEQKYPKPIVLKILSIEALDGKVQLIIVN